MPRGHFPSQKSKNPKITKSKNPTVRAPCRHRAGTETSTQTTVPLDFWDFYILDFGFLGFGDLGFWTFGILYLGFWISEIISGLVKRRLPLAALRVLTWMETRQVAPNIVHYTAAISACGKARQWRQALSLIGGMADLRLSPDGTTGHPAGTHGHPPGPH